MVGRFCPHLTVEVLSIVFKILYNIRIGGSEQRVDSFGREAAASRRQRPLCSEALRHTMNSTNSRCMT